MGPSNQSWTEAEPLSEINIVPLVDVLLGLLVIFMITAPIITPTLEVQLNPGDKLLLFTDGVELVAEGDKAGGPDLVSHDKTWQAMIASLAHHPIREIVVKLEAQLESQSEAATLHDDITLLGLQVLK